MQVRCRTPIMEVWLPEEGILISTWPSAPPGLWAYKDTHDDHFFNFCPLLSCSTATLHARSPSQVRPRPPIPALLTPPQVSSSPPSSSRTRSTSSQRPSPRPASRTPPAMRAGPSPAPTQPPLTPPRSRKVKCNRPPGQDKVRLRPALPRATHPFHSARSVQSPVSLAPSHLPQHCLSKNYPCTWVPLPAPRFPRSSLLQPLRPAGNQREEAQRRRPQAQGHLHQLQVRVRLASPSILAAVVLFVPVLTCPRAQWLISCIFWVGSSMHTVSRQS
jgi:hypothetical protein